MTLDVRKIEYFLAVVEHRSISGAAEGASWPRRFFTSTSAGARPSAAMENSGAAAFSG